MKRVAILQSNYIPWKGYFDIIAAADEFVIFDDVQFTKNDWRNRNKLKTPKGVEWISVPVGVDINRLVCEVELNDSWWQKKHWKMVESNYRRAPFFDELAAILEPIYLGRKFYYLSELNRELIETICRYLHIQTEISSSASYVREHGKTTRLVSLCRQAGATEYISGPSARSYIDEDEFTDNGIDVRWFDYSGYPEYPQLWGEFRHDVSVIDLLFNCGANANLFMQYV